MKTPQVEMREITKRFPGVIANDKVSLTIHKGEIHALLGENGAGKSTLMSILTGLYRPDGGEILINGEAVSFKSPKDAVAAGIGMVHQHFKLVNTFSVAENIILGMAESPECYNINDLYTTIREFADGYGLSIDPAVRVGHLSIGEQQRAEIVKVLFWGADILILDEPTAVLTPQEASDLYLTLRVMADQGKAIIVISHKLSEVMENTDRITVLRGGKAVGTVYTGATSEEELTQMMVGRHVIPEQIERQAACSSKVLSLEQVSCLGDRGEMAVKKVSLAICGGEILGIAGVAGNGQKELAELIAGLRPLEGGRKWLDGQDHTYSSIKSLIEAGISYVPEDRLGTGLVPGLDAVDNFILKSYQRGEGWLIDWKQARAKTEEAVAEFDIKMASLDNPLKLLSGGNLQKLLLAREICADPRLIIAMYPMRGLDVGAMESVRKLLVRERDEGKAVLLISEELDELFALSDRIAVLHEGEIMGVVAPQETTLEAVGMMMAGKRMREYHVV